MVHKLHRAQRALYGTTHGTCRHQVLCSSHTTTRIKVVCCHGCLLFSLACTVRHGLPTHRQHAAAPSSLAANGTGCRTHSRPPGRRAARLPAHSLLNFCSERCTQRHRLTGCAAFMPLLPPSAQPRPHDSAAVAARRWRCVCVCVSEANEFWTAGEHHGSTASPLRHAGCALLCWADEQGRATANASASTALGVGRRQPLCGHARSPDCPVCNFCCSPRPEAGVMPAFRPSFTVPCRVPVVMARTELWHEQRSRKQ